MWVGRSSHAKCIQIARKTFLAVGAGVTCSAFNLAMIQGSIVPPLEPIWVVDGVLFSESQEY